MNTAIMTQALKAYPETNERSRWARWRGAVMASFRSHHKDEKLERLIAIYRTLPVQTREAAANADARAMIEDVREQGRAGRVSWVEIAKVERAVLSMLSGEDLRRYAWALRAEFREALNAMPSGHELGKAYDNSNPPGTDAADEKRLKADLLTLQDKLHELCASKRTQVRARNRIAFSTVLISAAAIFITLQLDKILGIEDTIFFDVAGVGMLGGVFSTLLRIQKFKLGGNHEAVALSQTGNQLTVILAPLIGGAGAMVLFVLLAAGVLKGSLFPELPLIQYSPTTDALEEMFKVHLASSTEAAKLYLLCFLDGFSERLVPDVMSRLAAMARRDK